MPDTLIRGGTLIDGTGAVPVRDAGVLVVGGRIAAAGPLAEVLQDPRSPAAQQLDASGCWIIPGLIDAHIHSALTGAESMPVFLACGVTTVRDIGGPLGVVTGIRDAIARGGVAGPRFIFCGPLIDGEVPSFPPAALPIIESTPDAIAAADLADRCVAAGAGSIKLYFRLPRESLREVIRRIAGRVPVTGHLGRTRASEAVAEGINGLEHVIVTAYNDVVSSDRRFDAMQSSMADGGFWASLLAGWAEADLAAPGAQSLMAAMLERDVTLDPTLDITRFGMGTPRPTGEPDPNLQYVRAELRQMWEMRRAAAPGRPPEEHATADRGHAKCDEFVRRYHEMGGRVTAGTDVGAVGGLVPGFSLHEEIAMLVRAGMSNAAALRAATLDAAQALRIEQETGSIEPGKSADLVILEADPLADIENLGRMRTVLRTGTVHDSAAMLDAVAAAGSSTT